jgi:serine/threonine-protein kinase
VIGETLGSYKITRLIGKGGFGVVYAAEHALMGRKAAVKLLRPAYSGDKEIVQRFFNEARAAAMIKHPGIVEVYDVGRHTDGSAYLVMELLEGDSLASKLMPGEPSETPFVHAVGRQIAAALGAAHKKGIIHRDLKPENVFLAVDPESPDGMRVKLLDFGVAKLVSPTTSLSTVSGSVLGTPVYMSPEQCRGAERVDPRSDLYSLGCILYEMACGQPPFYERGLGDMIMAHIQREPRPPRELNATLPRALEDLILRLLAKSPDDRPQSADAVVDELDGLVAESERLTRRFAAGTQRRSQDPTTRSLPYPLRRRRRWVWLAAAGVLVAGAVTGGYALLVGRAAPPPTPAPAPIPPPALEAAPGFVVEKPRQVTLAIETRPPGAQVVRATDGVLVGTTPFRATVVQSDEAFAYVLKLRGYEDQPLQLSAHDDATRVIDLVAVVPDAPPPHRVRPHPHTEPPPGSDDPRNPFR